MKTLFGFILVAASVCTAQINNVSMTYGTSGLTAVSYNGLQYLSKGQFGVNAVNFVNSSGQISPGNLAGTSAFDPSHARTTISYSWGRIVVGYLVSNNKLSLTITTTNNSSLTIQGVFYEPLDLQFPSAPMEFDGVDPMMQENLGNPTAIRMTAGPNALVLANDDVTLPLLVGFPWSLNGPTNTIFPVRTETSQDSMLPNSIPFINRPILPGASDTYRISFRFGPSSATTKSLVSDVYQSFATFYPANLNWSDRRPIGQLIAASTATGFPTNPRGWFNDPTVDVTTPQGISSFQSRLLSWATNAVTVLKSMNAQGMITWDIEGEQYPQPTTYIGDPTVFATLAPEIASVIDQYFQTFTTAGLRVGICIRPQQLVFPTGGGAPVQTTVADPTSLLLAKISYAHTRWGATLFYIDSNGDPNFPISSSFFQTVAAQFPDVLLIPEHQTASYFAFGSWYGELRGGVTGTPQSVLDVYPQAFSVIYLPDGAFTQYQSVLTSAIKRGDIAMFRAWYTDPQNQEILSLYPPNGVMPPVPVVVTPTNNNTLTGTLNLNTTVQSGPDGVAGVQYLIDGVSTGSQLTGAPYQEAVDISGLSSGIHTLQAVASDPVGDQGFASENFFVGSSGGPPPPTITIATPSTNSNNSGVVLITAQPSASAGVASVQFFVDGITLGDPVMSAPFQMNWNTLLCSNTQHTISATVTDLKGITGNVSEIISVNNAVGAPYLSGVEAVPTTIQNLTQIGTADWVEWGLNPGTSANRKANTPIQIRNLTVIGSAPALSYTNNPIAFSWSDGSPMVTSSSTGAGLFVTGQGNGFSITVPASTSPQTVTVYTGVYMAQLNVTAQLSDNSAPAYADSSVSSTTGQQTAAYVFTFRAGSPGQFLTVTLTQANASIEPWSNITVSAAALRPYAARPRSSAR